MRERHRTKERLTSLIDEVIEVSEFIVLSDKDLHKKIKKIGKKVKKKGVECILEEGEELDE